MSDLARWELGGPEGGSPIDANMPERGRAALEHRAAHDCVLRRLKQPGPRRRPRVVTWNGKKCGPSPAKPPLRRVLSSRTNR
jgi:hypothetical protein